MRDRRPPAWYISRPEQAARGAVRRRQDEALDDEKSLVDLAEGDLDVAKTGVEAFHAPVHLGAELPHARRPRRRSACSPPRSTRPSGQPDPHRSSGWPPRSRSRSRRSTSGPCSPRQHGTAAGAGGISSSSGPLNMLSGVTRVLSASPALPYIAHSPTILHALDQRAVPERQPRRRVCSRRRSRR